MKRNDETQLRQIARDRVVVKDGLKELVRKIEAQREFAEALEKVLDDECDGKGLGVLRIYRTKPRRKSRRSFES